MYIYIYIHIQLREKICILSLTRTYTIAIISQLCLINGLSVSDFAENPIRSFDFDVLLLILPTRCL